ncbi:MAG: type II toxin-antitoxin system HicB family antitoxin [Candidatus Muiribacteriota bacterium]|jgi:predicted HicB family RNase H-like nuclease
MSKNILKYKNFKAEIFYAEEDNVFYGKILGINDMITFEGQSVNELKKEFKTSAEEYIKICEETGKKIKKSYTGNLNIRIKPELHKKLAEISQEMGISLNALINKKLEQK